MDKEKLSFTIGDPTYEVNKELHRGGQGIVYLVKNRTSGAEFAVKQYFASEPAALRQQMERSFKYGQIFSKQTVQGYFAPISLSIKEEEGLFLELMSVAPADCKTVEVLAQEWTEKELSSLDRIQDAVKILKSLLAALNKFHKSGFVHRDITGKNLFVAENNVFPIDFGVCAELDCHMAIPSFSLGFSHPYIMESSVSVQQDIYGACAVFVLLAMGDSAIDIETGGFVDLTNDYSVRNLLNMLNISRGIRKKLESMIQKVANFGYSDAEAFLKDVSSLEQIVESRGICKERLLDGSIRERDRVKRRIYGCSFDPALLPKIDIPTENTMIISPGGGGKTSSLINFWDRLLAADPLGRIPVYISLAKFNKGSTYICDYILDNYFQEVHSDDNRDLLRKLFREEQVVLLLDSVNESLHSDYLGPEISKLLECPGVQIIIASRHANIHWSELKEFGNMVLPPLDAAVVNAKLEAAGLPSAIGRLLETLTRPMFLCLFLNISKNPGNLENTPQTPGEILFAYYYTHLLNAFASADHTEDHLAFRKRCLFKFLPEFAFWVGSMTFDSVDWDNALQAMGIEPNSSDAVEFLSVLEDSGFIYRTGEDPFDEIVFFQFSHQFYHEFSLALFVAAQIFGRRPSVPAVLNQVLSDEVLHFLADIWVVYQKEKQIRSPISIEDWLQVHAARKQDKKIVVRNLVEVLKHQRDYNLRGLKFDGLDLSATLFYHCDLSDATFHTSILTGNSFVSEHHRHPLDKLLVAPKSKKLITSAQDESRLIVWEFDGNFQFSMDTDATIDQFDISSDEVYLAVRCGTFGNYHIQVFSLQEGTRLTALPCERPFLGDLFCFQPNTHDLLMYNSGDIVSFNISRGDWQTTLESIPHRITLTPDKTLFATYRKKGLQNHIEIYSTLDFQKKKTFSFEHANDFHFVFSADGKQLLGSSSQPYKSKEDTRQIALDIDTGTYFFYDVPYFYQPVMGSLKNHLFSRWRVWDYQAEKDISSLYGYAPNVSHRICFSGNGQYLGIIKNSSDISIICSDTLEPKLELQATTQGTRGAHIDSSLVRFVSPGTIMRFEPRGALDLLHLDDFSMIRLFTLQPKEHIKICKTPRFVLRIKAATFELWDTQEAQCLAELSGHLSVIKTAEYYPEECRLILLEDAFIGTPMRLMPAAIHFWDVSSKVCTTHRFYSDEFSLPVSCVELVDKKIIIGTETGVVEIINLAGELLLVEQAHHCRVERLVPVHKRAIFISCDACGIVRVWSLQLLDNALMYGINIDLSQTTGVIVDSADYSSESLDELNSIDQLTYTKLDYPEGQLYWIMKKYDSSHYRIPTDNSDVILIQSRLGEVEAYWMPTGETVCFIDELHSHEKITSADISRDGLCLATIADNGKTEIYQRDDIHSTFWDTFTWDLLDVDSVVHTDLSHADLKLCNDCVLDQLRLNGAILPKND